MILTLRQNGKITILIMKKIKIIIDFYVLYFYKKEYLYTIPVTYEVLLLTRFYTISFFDSSILLLESVITCFTSFLNLIISVLLLYLNRTILVEFYHSTIYFHI